MVPDADNDNNKQQILPAAPFSGGPQARKSVMSVGPSQQYQTSSKRKQMAFDDESVLKALKDNDEQSWSETCIQLISSTYRAIKIYIQMLDNQRSLDGPAKAKVEGDPFEEDEQEPNQNEQEQ